MKICVPLIGRNRDELIFNAREITESKHFKDIHLVELRYDFVEELKSEELLPLLKELKECLGSCKLLFTIRTREQGGEFISDFSSYQSLNSAAVESGYIDLVDVEIRREGYRRGAPTERDIKTTEVIIRKARAQGVKTIASYHDFEKTPASIEIRELFGELRESGADILKLAFMPGNEEDVLRLMLESRRFRTEDGERHEYITISMGRLGAISRIAGGISGSDYSFMSLGRSSAPGQLIVSDGLSIEKILGL